MRGRSMTRCALLASLCCASAQVQAQGHVQGQDGRDDAARPGRPATAAPGGYAWFVRGELLMRRGEFDKAAEAFDMARGQAEPRGGAMAVAAHALRLGGPEDPLLLSRIAEALDLAGRHAAADEVLAEARAAGPQSLPVALARARIAARRGKRGDAIAVLVAAVQRAPLSAVAAQALARQLRAGGQHGRAEAVLRELSARRRLRGQPDEEQGLRLAIAGSDAHALASATRRAADVPGQDDAMQAAAAKLLAAGLPAVAVEALRYLAPHALDAGLMLRALLAAEHTAAAEAWLAVHPAEALGGALAAAQAYLQVGRPRRAAELCELHLTSHPDDARARMLSARASLSLGRPGEAAMTAGPLAGRQDGGAGVGTGVAGGGQPTARTTVARALGAGGMAALAAEVATQ